MDATSDEREKREKSLTQDQLQEEMARAFFSSLSLLSPLHLGCTDSLFL